MRLILEKIGTGGAIVAALACPICFPKIALIGAALGLGALAPYEGYLAIGVQALFLLALIGHVVAFRQHRNIRLLAFAAAATLTLFAGFYVIPSSALLLAALGGLIAASIWHVVAMRRCRTCASEATPKSTGETA